jgi:alkanesulfonate monooxygenase SsuD/methylene tetrahydromethanopterin reductase-like flavin-dependent oxidoreductase (luciferase family)
MKLSFLCSQVYADPDLFARGSTWPHPPADYDPEIGLRSCELALQEAELAEDLGFDMVSVSEHHYWPLLPTPNAAVLAAALTQRVKRARIGWMGPIVSMANPVRIAEEAAMLDQLSHGRMTLLFLRGTVNEFLAYGVNPDETRARTQEAIRLIQMALTEPQPFGWEGEYFRYGTVSVWPGPTQRPHPPIFSSGNSPESLQFAAAQHHNMAMSFYPPHLVTQLVNTYREVCASYGWRPSAEQLLYRGFVVCAETAGEAAALRDRYFGIPELITSSPSVRGRGAAVADERTKRIESVEKLAAERTAREGPTEIGTDADGKNVEADRRAKGEGFGLGRVLFCGTADDVADQITRFYEQTGVGVLDLGFSGGGLTAEERDRALRLFGTEVLPRVQALGAESRLDASDAH